MAQNKGYLQADRTEGSNEQYTPFYAVDPITKYIPKDKKIWCPFDCEWSAFYQTFNRGGVARHTKQHRRRARLLRVYARRIRRDRQQSTFYEERRSIAQALRNRQAICNPSSLEFASRCIAL